MSERLDIKKAGRDSLLSRPASCFFAIVSLDLLLEVFLDLLFVVPNQGDSHEKDET